jgi:hypothetical protein
MQLNYPVFPYLTGYPHFSLNHPFAHFATDAPFCFIQLFFSFYAFHLLDSRHFIYSVFESHSLNLPHISQRSHYVDTYKNGSTCGGFFAFDA